MLLRRSYCFLLTAALACASPAHRPLPGAPATAAPLPPAAAPVTAAQALVVSAHPEASRIGLEILRRGGNAYDAAVAVQFALAVCFPVAGNIGGGGFVVYRAADGTAGALDFRETAPAKASQDMYLDTQGNVVPDLSTRGHLAAGVPGTVAGMVALHQKLGKLPWRELVQPAVDLAAQGVVLTPKEAAGLNATRFITTPVEAEQRYVNFATTPHGMGAASAPDFKELPNAYKRPGRAWQPGDTIRQAYLAATLGRIRDQGRAGFYQGPTAALLLSEMQRGHGLISQPDLDQYQPKWREPVRGRYRQYEVISMPPPSSGGVALLQLLQMLEPYNLRQLGWHSADAVHLITEAERRVYADRATYLGDPDFGRVPVAQLLGTKYLKGRMQGVTTQNAATPSAQVAAGAGLPSYESDQTTHYSIVDAAGNAVSCTTTLNGAYGSKVVVAGAGFLLNNEMDDFSVKPGVPNAYGVTGGAANAIRPGKRMLSSMTPTIVTERGQLRLVVGTPGGSTIITSVLQALLNVLDYGMNPQQAVAAPRLHHQWLPDQIDVEAGALSPAAEADLARRGYRLSPRNAWGRVEMIERKPNGQLVGGADPRGDDTALGY
ncbi:gamma-glutamyltransferase [Hymenobacter busanensis]|uniref:Glutathione hydrolase proenzyme n=1 Tax=Hymenobacter busanensis TaxID=2607656 RepID=A0A7L5A2I7_9BACT|nr:gamma-glutamyltransferase [Hymenobacter busanensis]KAA9338182.1 gamma-glutamyltransferase [Hymenobacter busanensis]QHJ09393.1 gamma-glutamyltransferase [Hymenobacter busanensis]